MSILSENLRSVSLNSHTRGDYPLAPASTANTWSQDLKDSARSIDRTVHASNPKPDVPLAQPISSTPQLRVNNKSLWSRMVRWYEDPVNSNIPGRPHFFFFAMLPDIIMLPEDEAQVVQAMISSSKPYAMTGLLTRSLVRSFEFLLNLDCVTQKFAFCSIQAMIDPMFSKLKPISSLEPPSPVPKPLFQVF
jgi:hypothetical protein